KMYVTRYGNPAFYAIADRFCALAAELGHAPTTLAVAWAASHPAVSAVLVGARDLAQLEPSLAAMTVALDEATRARISALSPEPPLATDRNEELTPHSFGIR